jgi:hypothetical protein
MTLAQFVAGVVFVVVGGIVIGWAVWFIALRHETRQAQARLNRVVQASETEDQNIKLLWQSRAPQRKRVS